ncbi:MAG: hypothetical protein M1497_15940 [Nitrospirae bacterium]|nr:hypothetical protein [Nitrospirota bacterium]
MSEKLLGTLNFSVDAAAAELYQSLSPERKEELNRVLVEGIRRLKAEQQSNRARGVRKAGATSSRFPAYPSKDHARREIDRIVAEAKAEAQLCMRVRHDRARLKKVLAGLLEIV